MRINNDRLKFSERIKKIIELVGSAEKLANISGMSSRVIGQYLAGKSDPSRIKLIALTEAAQVNIEWLATGKGPMKPSAGDAPKYDEKLLRAIIKTSESYWIKEGKNLNPSDKADIITAIYAVTFGDNLSEEELETLELTKGFDVWNTTMSMAIEQMDDPVSGEKFRKYFGIFLERFLAKEGGLGAFVNTLSILDVLGKHLKEGALSFVKDKDGKIRLINVKDLNKEL